MVKKVGKVKIDKIIGGIKIASQASARVITT